ncbi:MAG: alcohol dehydrogenase [Hyphomicrobiales bacterium]|nr:MAG: alcohol dehydrogenase [Hyphomicrobiales bacterium]
MTVIDSARPAYPVTVKGAVLRKTAEPGMYTNTTPLAVEELTLAAPGPNEVLVRIEAAGVCHSDLSVINGSRPRPLPMLLGHEAAGIVVDFGEEVLDLPPGQRVVAAFLPRCGDCAGCRTDGRQPCAPGSAANANGTLLGGDIKLDRDGEAVFHHLGVSGFATHAVIDRRSLVPVDHDVPPSVAAVLGCALLTGGGAVLNVVRPTPETSVAVVGLGGVGMAALITARALGVKDLIAVDQLVEKLDKANTLGATRAYTPQQASAEGVTADLVIEAAGHPRAFETAVEITAAGGSMVTVGLPAPDARASLSPLSITAEAKSIHGSYLGSAIPSRDIPVFVDLWRRGALDIEALISDTIRLDDLNTAMDRLHEGVAIRQVIVFD